MIGIPSATAAGAGDSLPILAAAPTAGRLDADLAFDDVFRQLTGTLLSTSAVAAKAAVEAEVIPEEAGGDDQVDSAGPLAAVPLTLMLPFEAATPVEGMLDGGDLLTASAGTTSAGTTPASEADSGPAVAAAVAAPGDQAVEHVLTPLDLPAVGAGTTTPPTDVGADVRGLDGRRGMRETPVHARSSHRRVPETTGDAAAPAVAALAAGAIREVAADSVTAEGALEAVRAAASAAATAEPRTLPVPAERVFALQRALAKQTDHGTVAPGLSAQADAGTVGHPTPPDGSGTGHDRHAPGSRQSREWLGTLPAGSPAAIAGAASTSGTPAAAGALPAGAQAADGASAWAGAAGGAAWRAALAATSFTEGPGVHAEAARMSGAPGLSAIALASVELRALSDRGPLVDDTPLPAPTLDAATGESVHSQIVKSMRLQWSGGLGEAKVTLKPGYLGEVVAAIKVDQGVVTATLHADTPEVRRWMESHTATLRDALVEHGLKLDRLTVAEPERQDAPGDRQAKPRQRQPDQHRPRARRQAPDSATPFDLTTE